MLAFELAFRYRNPVVVLADGYLGQMTGKVALPRALVRPGLPGLGRLGRRRAPAQPRSRSILLDEADLEAHNLHLDREVRAHGRGRAARRAVPLRRRRDVVLVACNTPARMAKGAVQRAARARASRAGLFRPQTLWPFPIDALLPLLDRAPADRRGRGERRASSRTSCGWR